MNRPKIFTLLQTLLDSTPLPRDILEYVIVPDLLPSPGVARMKMKSVMRSLLHYHLKKSWEAAKASMFLEVSPGIYTYRE